MNQSTEKGLEFNGRLPLSVEKIARIPGAAELVTINMGNEQLLRTVMLLEEKLDVDEDDEVLQELKKQDMKINLLLDMLSTLLIQNNAIPPAQDITLTDSWVRLKGDDLTQFDGECCVKLYINPAMPRPLMLYGACKQFADTNELQITFQGMSQNLVNGLDKFIFRFHRRMVANSRTA
ncbi:MAG: PilZ domain-containing protein [Pseudomonadota bacterium]